MQGWRQGEGHLVGPLLKAKHPPDSPLVLLWSPLLQHGALPGPQLQPLALPTRTSTLSLRRVNQCWTRQAGSDQHCTVHTA